jgi:hypothetical protein
VLNNGRNQLAILEDRPHLLRDGLLREVAFVSDGHADIESAGLARDDLRSIDTILG